MDPNLALDLAGLDDHRPGLSASAVRYVLEGGDDTLLDELGGTLPLKLTGRGFAPLGHKRWLASTPLTPAQRARLGKVYDAVTATQERRAGMQVGLPDGVPAWVQLLAWEASSYQPNGYGPGAEGWWDWATWAAVLVAGGQPPDLLFRALLTRADEVGGWGPLRVLIGVPGVAAAVEAHPEVVRDALAHPDVKVRAHAVGLLSPHVPAERLLALVVPLALDKAKTVRVPAAAWLEKSPAAAIPALREQATSARSGDARAFAVELLWRMAPAAETRAFLAAREPDEPSAAARQAILTCLAEPAGAPAPVPQAASVLLPPITPLDAAARDVLRGALAQADAEAAKAAAAWARFGVGATDVPGWASRFDTIVRVVEAEVFPPDARAQVRGSTVAQAFSAEVVILDRMARAPSVSLATVLRLAMCLGLAGLMDGEFWDFNASAAAIKWFRARKEPPDFTRYAAEIARLGGTPAAVGAALLGSHVFDGLPWTPASTAAFFAAHPDALAEALGPGAPDWGASTRRRNALRVCAATRPAASLVPVLWGFALGSVASERALAQRALAGVEGTVGRVVATLADPKADVRRVAADWLAALRAPESVPALEKAVVKERSEPVKAAMMVALEALGVPLDRFLDRAGMVKESEKVLAKGLPAELAWVPFDRLPTLRWADDGAEVPAAVLRAWCVQALRLKSAEPGPLLRRYAAFLRGEEAAAVGSALIRAWIAEDTRPIDEAEARSRAVAAAPFHAQWTGSSLAEAEEQLFRQHLETPAGSAIGTKGLLAVAAALSPPDAPELVQGYLKRWYGLRAAQCRALLQMLSWVDRPAAIQVVLATAARFRTAGIRAEAEACVNAIAERRGWTVDELADRTVPTAGFDDDGVLELDYGPRRFVARLGDDLGIRLETSDGRALAALPEPRADDDAERAGAAKKALAEAKKQLKVLTALQRDRLYEAMCTGRRWRGEDWRAYVLGHPVVGRLARGLVWRIEPAAGAVRLARPLGDGSLTDADDGGVEVHDGDTVSVAHALDLDADARATWVRHLAEYEVAPLFAQLTRGAHRLPDGEDVESEVVAFRGHLVEAFKLRGRATKLGYGRGPAEDGGWFHRYLKRFPTLGLSASIEFSGNALPEENRTVALTSFRFLDGDGGEARPLGQVPAVLLSEVWSDVAEIAAQGTGYDPEWERTTSP